MIDQKASTGGSPPGGKVIVYAVEPSNGLAVGVGLVADAEVLLGRVAQDAEVGAGRAGQVVVAEQLPAAEDLRRRPHPAGTGQHVVEPGRQAGFQLRDAAGVGKHAFQLRGVPAPDAEGARAARTSACSGRVGMNRSIQASTRSA